jgi:hypothetical protein
VRILVKLVLALVVLGLVGVSGAWVWAGRQTGPTIQFRQPDRFVGQDSTLELTVEAPEGRLSQLDVTVEQDGKSLPVFNLDRPADGAVKQDSPDRFFVIRPIGKKALPDLKAGPAKIVVRAGRPVLRGLRTVSAEASKDVQVRLEPPAVAVLSQFHYVNLGGAEFVVYRATPADVESGVRVGDREFRGFPGSAVGITNDPAVRVAFFALGYDQDVKAAISVFARDAAGNLAVTALDHQAFPKPFSKSTIPVDTWVERVVQPILANTPDLKAPPSGDIAAAFVLVNSDLRKKNAQTLVDLSKKTEPTMHWNSPFQALGNAAVEAKFADFRTYTYQKKEIDRQVHLGFDLAVTTQIPILAAQDGVVVHAAYLGIYGNCVVIDHGLGVQTLYGHLSSMGVKVGDKVTKGQQIGRSGMTGLAAGDHLHFTVLVDGVAVNPVEWWDQKWMQDRVFRKVVEAGGHVS